MPNTILLQKPFAPAKSLRLPSFSIPVHLEHQNGGDCHHAGCRGAKQSSNELHLTSFFEMISFQKCGTNDEQPGGTNDEQPAGFSRSLVRDSNSLNYCGGVGSLTVTIVCSPHPHLNVRTLLPVAGSTNEYSNDVAAPQPWQFGACLESELSRDSMSAREQMAAF